jgi:hypothetical protein
VTKLDWRNVNPWQPIASALGSERRARAVFEKYGITLRRLSHGTILDVVDHQTAFAALLELAKIFSPEPPKEE